MAQRQSSDARLITVVETREFQQRAATRMSEAVREHHFLRF
jgi:predicted N-acetyltransferase YhbS